MKPGQDLVAAGYAGLEGTRIIVEEKRQELEKYFAAGYLDSILEYSRQAEECRKKLNGKSFTPEEIESAAEGGILTAIWKLSGSCRLGVEFSLRRIPVLQGTIEICEVFGLNPYRLYSKGCWVQASDNGGQLVERLREVGIPAAVIGRITKGIARLVINGGETGYLNRPQPDELEKVIQTECVTKKEAVGYEREDFSSDREEQQN